MVSEINENATPLGPAKLNKPRGLIFSRSNVEEAVTG